jgi:hypothetical protein
LYYCFRYLYHLKYFIDNTMWGIKRLSNTLISITLWQYRCINLQRSMFHMLLLSPYLKSIQKFLFMTFINKVILVNISMLQQQLWMPFGFLAPKNFKNILAFKYFVFEPTWWRLFKKRVVHTKFDVFVLMKVETEVIISITASLKDELRY